MPDDCDKYLKKAKQGLVFFSTAFLIGVLKKSGLTDEYLGTDYDVLFIIWIIITIVVTLVLTTPYTNCLMKNNKKRL